MLCSYVIMHLIIILWPSGPFSICPLGWVNSYYAKWP